MPPLPAPLDGNGKADYEDRVRRDSEELKKDGTIAVFLILTIAAFFIFVGLIL